MSKTSDAFTEGCAKIRTALTAFSPKTADLPYRPGGWTRKQVLGHMLDSAANNHQRFVRAALDGSYAGPGYQQNGWVDLHGYAELPWETLLELWMVAHAMLQRIVSRIPEERLTAMCAIAEDAPVTLQFLIDDYVVHQRHHLQQIVVDASMASGVPPVG